jgi:hypothetical protein
MVQLSFTSRLDLAQDFGVAEFSPTWRQIDPRQTQE